jgi:hypothetical protein
MFWKPVSLAKPAGSFNVTDQEAARGELTIRFDRAPSQEWTRIFTELWSEKGTGEPEPVIQGETLRFTAITKEEFAASISGNLEELFLETNVRQAEQVAKKMGMPASKQDAAQANSEFQSAIGTINWG